MYLLSRLCNHPVLERGWATPGSTQGLLLTLCSGDLSGKAQVIECDAGTEPGWLHAGAGTLMAIFHCSCHFPQCVYYSSIALRASSYVLCRKGPNPRAALQVSECL